MSDSNSNGGSDGSPSFSINARVPNQTGRKQEVVIVPENGTLKNQVLAWDPATGQPRWKQLSDLELDQFLGPPAPLLMNDTLPLLAGDGQPYLFRARLDATA